jgi:hypothetical protein
VGDSASICALRDAMVDCGARVGGATLLMSSSLVSMYEMESSGATDIARAARGWKVEFG